MDFNSIKHTTQNLILKKNQDLGITTKPKIVLGLSGGPDSIFLLHVLAELKNEDFLQLIATHFDHQWRTDSVKDVEFCKEICQKLDVNLIAAKASELAIDFKFNGSKEELGRRMRRTLFESVMQNQDAQFIALAHHAQDQQETFFIRLIRGTTLSGLRCMNLSNSRYIRPLLETNKDEIVEYLNKNKIKFLTDPTNVSDMYLRNRIRNHVLPALKQCDQRFDHKFKSTLHQLKTEDDFLQNLAQQEFEHIFAFQPEQGHQGNLYEFKKLHPVLQRRILIYWFIKEKVQFKPSTNYLDEALKFLNSKQGGQHKLGEVWMIKKSGKSFKIIQA